MDYWHWLGIASLTFLVLERVVPWHRPNRTLRRGWLRDLAFLVLNGHLFGYYTAGLNEFVFDRTSGLLAGAGLDVEVEVASGWPLWTQFVAVFFFSDFLQWCTHICLHKVPFLWTFHKVHHSIPRLDWIANFHFHWFEHVVYKTAQALPLAWLGVSYDAAIWYYVLGTFWGHFNHANIPWRIGPLKYLFNSPHMHIWHHDASDEGGVGKNYGIVLSLWDWVFGTAYWPQDREPTRLGYPGDEEMPQTLGGQMTWPLCRAFRVRRSAGPVDMA